MKLDYFQDGRFYNGLLSKQTWLADSVQRSYLYDYDKANRYINALFSGSTAENYNDNAAYDANGNILKLNRFGESSPNAFSRIDSLNYSYATNSNRLNGITDLANNAKGHIDNGNVTDYTYYTDGSLKTDANKGITNTIYNYLGLPDEIQFGSNGKIKNLYTSDGQKLAQLLISGTDTVRTDYVGDLIYKNGILETVFHDEGRIKVALDTTINNWSDTLGNQYSDTTIALNTRYQYFIQDHLGNNRVIFEKLTDSLFVAQRIDYYPFGSPFSDSLSFVFTYQGKEYINFLGYDSYNFHARGLDTWSGRFSGLDPVANYSLSGYASMMNNPISYIDPDGRNPLFIGAFVAIFANSAIKMAQGKSINSMWDFLKPGITGAIGGGLGSLAPIGVLPGMAYGTGSGAVTGTINSALNGSNIGRGALYGAIGGGVFGGINGYLSTPEGVNPWTGNGTTTHAFSMTANQSGNNWTSTEEMRTSYDGTIGLKDNMSLSEIEDKINTNVSLASKNNLPSKDYFMDNGTIAFTKADGSIGHAGGVTNASYKFGFIKNSYIRISPSIKSTAIEYQNLVFKHEFMHAWHWSSAFKNYNLYTERATSAYTLAYIKAYNLGDNWATTTRNVISSEGGMYYPKNYSWRNFNKIIKLWLN